MVCPTNQLGRSNTLRDCCLLPFQIIELLHHVHAHEIFLNGEFNGDPHPGNIMLLNDGRIGLIDYGQVRAF